MNFDNSNAFPEILINALPSGIISYDHLYRVTAWNHASEKIFNLRCIDAIGKDIRLIPHFKRNSSILKNFKIVLLGESISEVCEIYSSDGQASKKTQISFVPLMDDLGKVFGGLLNLTELEQEYVNTQGKKFDSKGKESRQFSTIFQKFRGLVYEGTYNSTWLLSFISDGCRDLTGYQSDDFLSNRVNYFDLVLPDYKSYLVDNIQNALLNNESFDVEYPIRTASGEIKWVWEYGQAFYDENRITHIEGFVTEITRRKEAERDLIKSEERFRLLFEKSPIALGISRGGITLQANRAYTKLFGYEDPSEILGKSLLEQVAPSERAEITQRIKARDNGEEVPFSYKTIGLKKDGSQFPFHIDVAYFELPDGLSTIVYIKDISEEQEAVRKLNASVKKFKTLFDSELMGITINDAKGGILDANKTFLNMLGFQEVDMTTGELNWHDITPPEYSARDQESLEEIFTTGMIKPFEKEYFRKDGSRLPVLVGAKLFEKEETGVTFVIDLSQLKQSRSQLETINKELNTFLYMASHDLKGPLASVVGLTEIALNESKDPTALQYLNLISQSTVKLDRSLMNLLKIMKIKSDNDEKEEILFDDLLEEIKENLRKLDGYDKVKISFNIGIKSAFIGNIGIVNSVLQNLIENSIKYQSIYNGPPFVEVRINELGSNIVIDVEDNGRGIDPAIKSRVFDMFYRGTSDSKGSGLGLYIVKCAVEKIGGTIDFQPRANGGTVFTLVLPK